MISAVIIAYNEEDNIRDCLESIKWVDEIIVVDSGSQDKTIEIAKEYTDKIFKKEWTGFGRQKEYAKSLAKYDWVLSIDADERITSELKDEILKSRLEKDAYYIPRKFYWLSRWMKYGGCGKEKYIRLFKKNKARFSDDCIHEKLIVNGKIGNLKSPILHYSYKNISDYFERFNKYSSLEALKKDPKGGLVFQIFLSLLDFIKRYIFKLGFLDGIPGLLWALFSSFHRLVKYAKVWENSIK